MKKSLSILLIGIALSAASSMASAAAAYVAPTSACKEQELEEHPAICDRLQKAFTACSKAKSHSAFEQCVDTYNDKHDLDCSLAPAGDKKENCVKANRRN